MNIIFKSHSFFLNKLRYVRVPTLMELFLVLIVFLSIGLWRLQDALFLPEVTLAMEGDGVGTIAYFYDLIDNVKIQGTSLLFGDLYHCRTIGAGLNEPVIDNPLWKVTSWLLSFFFSPDNVYDFNAFLGFVLIGFFSYILMREIGVSRSFALIAGVLITHLDNYEARIVGHLTLATYYFPIFLLWCAVRAGKKPNAGRLTLFTFSACLNFLGNEYIGYFGGIFAALIFLGYLCTSYRVKIRKSTTLIRNIGIAGLVFLFSMCLAYPNLIFLRLLPFKSSIESFKPYAHPVSDFYHYSMKWENLGNIFIPSISLLRSITPDFITKSPIAPEFTFRIGLIIPFATLVMVIIALYLFFRRHQRSYKSLLWEACIWSSSTFILFLFAVTPAYPFSLARLTMKAAPMFRVSNRALLFVDIGAIIIFSYLMSNYFQILWSKTQKTKNKIFKVSCFVMVLFLFALSWVAFADVRAPNYPVTHKLQVHNLPDASLYNSLKGKPGGYLLELPFYFWPDPPHYSYRYAYFRTAHGNPIINCLWNPKYDLEIRQFGYLINRPSEAILRELQATGVRYLVVRPDSRYDYSYLKKSSLLEKLGETPEGVVYQINGDTRFDSNQFLKRLIRRDYIPDEKFEGSLLPSTFADSKIVQSFYPPYSLVRYVNNRKTGEHEYLAFGPHILMDKGRYLAVFSIAGRNVQDGVDGLLFFDAVAFDDAKSEDLRASKVIFKKDFPEKQLVDIELPFTLEETAFMEFRCLVKGRGEFYYDHVRINSLE